MCGWTQTKGGSTIERKLPIQQEESSRKNTEAIIIPIPRRETITEVVARQLSRLIASEQWKPGERLPSESELARRFQAGRSAIREAIKSLAVAGLVSVRRGKGTFVNNRSDFLVGRMSLGLEPSTDLQAFDRGPRSNRSGDSGFGRCASMRAPHTSSVQR